MRPLRILIVRFSAIGDCVMATWGATALRGAMRSLPDARLAWAVEARCAPVVASPGLAHRRVEIPRKEPDGTKRRGVALAQMRLFAGLRREAFDVGVDLQGHGKTALCLRLAGPRVRLLAQAQDALAARLAPTMPSRPEGTHEVDWATATLARATGLDLIPEPPILPPVPARDPGLVTISVAAGHPDKALPPATVAEVARALVARGLRVELLGGPLDRAPDDLGGARDRVGALALGETLARVGSSALHLSGDTGTAHMASAAGTPTVTVFGPTDPARYRPYGGLATVLREGDRTDAVASGEVIAAACAALGGR